jgi:hypothetical protein
VGDEDMPNCELLVQVGLKSDAPCIDADSLTDQIGAEELSTAFTAYQRWE